MFLHPEWQFAFLRQVIEITGAGAMRNHVLMSSYSASSITTADDSFVNLFEFDDRGHQAASYQSAHGRKLRQQVVRIIELLFYGNAGLENYFVVDTDRTDGFIKFISDGQKVAFAKDIVSTIDAAHFEVFRPIFDFVKAKCVQV